ncbi:ABC transporter permease [Thalassotalea fusca]
MLDGTMTTKLALTWQFLKEDFNLPHQRLLRWTQGVLLVFIMTLSLSSTSIQHYLRDNLQNLLGADAVLVTQRAVERALITEILQRADDVVVTQQFTATLTANDKWQSAKLKAVDQDYPLQGELLTAESQHAEGNATLGGPSQGSIWLDARLLASLSLQLGDTIQVANQMFTISRVLVHEPDRIMEGHTVDMRGMLNIRDMERLKIAEELTQFRYLIAASNTQISQLIDWQKQQLPAATLMHKQGNHPLALFWQRTENVLGLSSIILFFMAAIAMKQLSQVHQKKDQYFSAICMSFGASKNAGIQLSLFKWLMNYVLLIPVALAIALFGHWLIIQWLGETFTDLSWQWHGKTIATTLASISLIFVLFHAPVWLSLRQVSVAKLFAGYSLRGKQMLFHVFNLAILFLVALQYTDNGLLTFMMVSAIAITIGFILVLCWLSLVVGEKLTQGWSGLLPFVLFMMRQRIVSKSTQILGIGLSTFLLLFTLMLMKDIGATMENYQRQNDGNLVVSQATATQFAAVEDWVTKHNASIRQQKSYLHAKLVSINDVPVDEFAEKPSDSLATLSKQIRLHWNDQLPENNRIVSGTWWQPNESNWQQISVEDEVLTDLGLNLGDTLTFHINNQLHAFEITASHAFKSGGGSITFWIQMPTSALAQIDARQFTMATLEINEQDWPALSQLWQQFPTLRMMSIKEMTERFDRTLSMITSVISGFSTMITLLAIIVLLASVKAFEQQDNKKNSVVLSFGLSHKVCLKLNLIEWLTTAIITAGGAILGTYFAGLLIYQSQFSLVYQPDFIWLIGVFMLVIVSITTLGVLASKQSLKSSVRQLMAET